MVRPQALSAREKRLARIRGDLHPLMPHKTHRDDAVVDDGFLSSKKDKRIMKHSGFMAKVSAATSKKTLKRRRPNKKLVATMESLADALPELTNEADGNIAQLREGKVRHKSLKSRPGALKRKEKVVKGEMARFGASMAALARTSTTEALSAAPTKAGEMQVETEEVTAAAPAPSTSNRWALLRAHISNTMEQNPAFTG
ncbi:ribosome biogenesis protein SLX9-domain-containing protein [Plectosphaerella plurivora]|uniref:Ribosome biogenesis protein SLX9 n=1 Tax=Plectosphaerella plurivora TaxID=936078 RepID=A0A9P8VIQ8_9PEZI|nr:ribosome biogenesis protein SLX9-domain-containing protein [Plectosphaerella plurivora]